MLLRPVFVGGMVCSVTHKDLKQKKKHKMDCSVTHKISNKKTMERKKKKRKKKKILLNTGQENNITQPKTNKFFSFSSHFPSFFTV